MLMSNYSSSSMTSSTVSSESAPRSFTNEVSGVIFSLSTPSCSATISMTRSATDATVTVLLERDMRPGAALLCTGDCSLKPLLCHSAEPNRIEEIRKLGQDGGSRLMTNDEFLNDQL